MRSAGGDGRSLSDFLGWDGWHIVDPVRIFDLDGVVGKVKPRRRPLGKIDHRVDRLTIGRHHKGLVWTLLPHFAAQQKVRTPGRQLAPDLFPVWNVRVRSAN